MTEHKELLRKWLRVLFYVHTASLVIGIVNAVSNLDAVTAWVSRVLSVITIWSISQLKHVSPRYRKAAIFQTVLLVCLLITASASAAGTGVASIAVLVGSGCSLVATYQEYHAHAEVVAEQNRKLAEKWNALFGWEILVGALSSLISGAAALLLASAQMDTVRITTIILILTNVCSLLLQGLYLHYMNQTLKLIDNTEEFTDG